MRRSTVRSPPRVPDAKRFDVRTQPQAHLAPWKLDYRVREVRIAPGVDRDAAGLGETQQLRDFSGPDEILGFDERCHRRIIRRACDTDL